MKVLLAGGTGRVGTAIMDESAARGIAIRAVLRSQGSRSAATRWTRSGWPGQGFEGDVTMPRWGLTPADVERLADVDVVLNLAAETRWGESATSHYRTNLLGAVNGFDLASTLSRQAGRPVLYCYVSSVFAAGSRCGFIPEVDHGPDGQRTAYENTKWLAEVRLRHLERKDRQARLSIVRLGGIIGRHPSRPFSASTLELLNSESNLIFGRVPVWAGGRVDVLERTQAARWLLDYLAVIADADRGEVPPFVHLCAGTSAPTLRTLLEAARTSCLESKRILPLPNRTADWLRSPALRALPWSSRTKTLLDGVKHVGEDRVFERHQLLAVLNRLPEPPPVDRIAQLVFGAAETPERQVPEPLGYGSFVS